VLDGLASGLADAGELLELVVEEQDEATAAEVGNDLAGFEQQVNGLEFRRMSSGEPDANDAFLDI
jgi:peptide chain release factor 2